MVIRIRRGVTEKKGFLKDSWENLEEYLYSAALLVMTFITFMNVFPGKTTWSNTSFVQELVTTIFAWVCRLVTVSVLKTDSHMDFSYLVDKFTGTGRRVYCICGLLSCSANYGIWIIWGAQTVYRQYHYHLFTGVPEMSQRTIGIAIPLPAVLSIARMAQHEIRLAKSS